MLRCFSFILTLFVIGSGLTFAQTEEKTDQTWQVVQLAGQRVGYSQTTTHETKRDGQKVLETDSMTNLSIRRFGQTLKIKQLLHVEETPDGKLLRFTSVMDNPPNSKITSTGVMREGALHLTTIAGGTEKTKTLNDMEDVVSPVWAERYLDENGLEVGEKIEFTMFEAQMGKKTLVTLKRLDDSETEVWGGEKRKLQTYNMTQSVLPGVAVKMYLDEEGNVQKASTPLLGMEIFTVSEEEALKQPTGEIVDLAMDTLVKVEGLSGNPHKAQEITYRVEVDGSDPEELFENDDSQTIKKIDEDEVDLTVRSLDPTKVEGAGDTEPRYLAATRFLECDNSKIKSLAEEGDGDAADSGDVAVALEKFVREYVDEKGFTTSMATALEVANSKAGDCSEHAVLLAALLRAKQIPSRVAIGFVYAPKLQAFGGHMWTEAFVNGTWVPLDATLGQGGIGAGHIKVATASLDEDGVAPASEMVRLIHLLGRMKVKVLSQK